MAELTIGNRTVTIDDAFLKMSPDDQNRTVYDIAKQLNIQPEGQQQTAKPASPPNDAGKSSAIGGAPKEVGYGEDVAKAIPSGVARGVAGFVGLPGMIGDATNWLGGQTIGRVTNAIEGNGFTARTGDEVSRRAKEARQNIFGIPPIPSPAEVFTYDNAKKGIEAVTGPLYEPQTMPGKVAGTIAEFAAPGGLLTKGTMAQRAAQVVVPAITSELSGEAAKALSPELEPYARVLGGLVGGIGVGVAQTKRGADAMIQQALGKHSEADVKAAVSLMQDAASGATPVRITLDEALNKVTSGNARDLTRTRRVVENTDGPGAKILDNIASKRPAEMQGLAKASTATIEPNLIAPEMASGAAQRSAEDALTTVRGYRAASTKPFYDAAKGDKVPASEVQKTVDILDRIIAADPTGGELSQAAKQIRADLVEKAAVQGQPATRTPVIDPKTGKVIRYEQTAATPGEVEVLRTNASDLDKVFRAARDGYLTAPNVGETGMQATARRASREAIEPLNTAILDASPNIRAGRDVHRSSTETLVSPAENGPLGRIASIDTAKTGASAEQGAALVGKGESARSADWIEKNVKRMARENPEAAGTIVHDYVADTINNAMKDTQGGPNVMGAANARKALIGNEADAVNLKRAITALPDGNARWAGLQRFLDIAEASGYKPPKGSDTAFNQAAQADLKGGMGWTKTAIKQFGQLGLGVKQAVGDGIERWQMAGQGERFAKMITDPTQGKLLIELARTPVGSAKSGQMMLRLLATEPTATRSRE